MNRTETARAMLATINPRDFSHEHYRWMMETLSRMVFECEHDITADDYDEHGTYRDPVLNLLFDLQYPRP